MNARESRKQLLIAESELNRAHLVHELKLLAGNAHALAERVKTAGSMASAVALLVAGLASFRRRKSTAAGEKPSWWQTVLKGAGVVGSLWSQFRPRDPASRDKFPR
jgi:MprA protease rhombosortase-interaction domain-containing protein